MSRTLRYAVAGAVLFVGAACSSDSSNTAAPRNVDLANAFDIVPAGFSATNSSFSPSGDIDGDWSPKRGRPGWGAGFMGGGLAPEFFGGIGFGRGIGFGPFGDFGFLFLSTCTFSSTTGRVTCDPVTFRGLTVNRSAAFTDAAGKAQQHVDDNTNTINVSVGVSGTITRRNGNTITVKDTSDRTVGGLAPGSTQRTVDGASSGEETRSGTSDDGPFTSDRVVGDTTQGLIIPLQSGHPTFPTAGTVIRSMKVTVTIQGQSPATTSRREVITYDGSNTAKVVITKDGTTKNCTLPLPFGRLSCQ